MSEEERKVAPYASEVISFRIEKDVAERYRQLPQNIKSLVIETSKLVIGELIKNIEKIMLGSVNVNVELKVTPVEKIQDTTVLKTYEKRIDELKKTIELLNKQLARLEAIERKYNNIKEIVRQYHHGYINSEALATHLHEMFKLSIEEEAKVMKALLNPSKEDEE